MNLSFTIPSTLNTETSVLNALFANFHRLVKKALTSSLGFCTRVQNVLNDEEYRKDLCVFQQRDHGRLHIAGFSSSTNLSDGTTSGPFSSFFLGIPKSDNLGVASTLVEHASRFDFEI
ncbi:hypothetical protein BpHYR1_040080 [Brachionus plicatilis]|uniref:Uncharacterized protein n=1 Tax=Brachionus plicatilis TaxID=10195 RepID=A0A3M7RCR9_BRAPC|nr:hypothetical protein BpHYR1_040080 [Brachionus plicatilis]